MPVPSETLWWFQLCFQVWHIGVYCGLTPRAHLNYTFMSRISRLHQKLTEVVCFTATIRKVCPSGSRPAPSRAAIRTILWTDKKCHRFSERCHFRFTVILPDHRNGITIGWMLSSDVACNSRRVIRSLFEESPEEKKNNLSGSVHNGCINQSSVVRFSEGWGRKPAICAQL